MSGGKALMVGGLVQMGTATLMMATTRDPSAVTLAATGMATTYAGLAIEEGDRKGSQSPEEQELSSDLEHSQEFHITPENMNEFKLAQSSAYERALAATTDKFVETRKTLENTYDKVQEHASNLKAKFKGFADKAMAFKDDMVAKFTNEPAVETAAMTASELTETDAPQIEATEPVLSAEEHFAEVEALRAERTARLASLEQEEMVQSATLDRSEGAMMNDAWADAMEMEDDHSR